MGAQNTNCTMKFIDIPEDRQREAINTVALQTGLPPSSIEKDWWVTQVLKALHTLPYAEHIAFKGGTSLSKCWNLITRFSETWILHSVENSLALAVNYRRLKSATDYVAPPVLS